MLMRVLAPAKARVRSGKSEREEGVTLTELLVVISIMVILMAIMASALGAFTHTSRVDAAADTLVSAFREARFYAMSKNVNVLPIILRDQKGKHTIVYGARALNFRGSLADSDAPPQSYTGASNPWTMYREELDGASLANGAFVYMVGTNTLDLSDLTSDQAYFEMTYMKVTPPASAMERGDSSKWTYDIVGRGIHNTAYGTFNFTTTNYGGADGYVVVSGTGANYTFGTEAQMRDFTLSGFNLPDHIVVDQAPMLTAPAAYEERVAGILHAYSGRFYEDALLTAPDPSKQHFPKEWYPLFLPIFQPDGRVKTSPNTSFLGGLEEDTGALSGIRNMVLRVVDTVTREQRYVVIGGSKDGQGGGSTGAIYVSMTLPKRYGKGGESAVPDYTDAYDLSNSTTTNSTASNSSNSASSTNSNSTASTTSNSSTSSTGTASTSSNSTASSNTSNTSNTATSNASNTSNTSNTNTSNTSATSNTGSTSSNSASTSSSTGTASTSASNSSTSNSSNNTTSNSSTANSSTSNTSSNSTSNTSTATTTGTPSSSGVSSSSGGTSSGDGTYP